MHVCESATPRRRASDCSNNGGSDVRRGCRRSPNWSADGAAVSHKVELSRQWSEVKRGGPRKGGVGIGREVGGLLEGGESQIKVRRAD